MEISPHPMQTMAVNRTGITGIPIYVLSFGPLNIVIRYCVKAGTHYPYERDVFTVGRYGSVLTGLCCSLLVRDQTAVASKLSDKNSARREAMAR